MNTLTIVVLIYICCALLAYLFWNFTDFWTRQRKPPRTCFRWATPWYYTPYGNWFLGYWQIKRGFPKWGIRVLGFEYWVEYYK
jgi:hypothetical protein